MEIKLTESTLSEKELSFTQIGVLLDLYFEKDIGLMEVLQLKGLIKILPDKPILRESGRQFVEQLLDNKTSKNDLETLVEEMRNCFPEGKKSGSFYWRAGPSEIHKKLTGWFKKNGKKYSNEEIIEATKKYVNGFQGQYQYMSLLKYFIEKDGVSTLLTMLENKNEIDNSDDWTSNRL